MTPTNPDNNQPLIYRICDALGITHLVVAVQHSHLMSEITGLAAALAGKMDAKTIDSEPANNSDHLVSSKGVYNALQNKADINSPASSITNGDGASVSFSQNGDIILTPKSGRDVAFMFNGSATAVSASNAGNFVRALQTPDSTPTADSDNLVTSGGVKAAIDEATKAAFESSLPYYITTAHEKMKVYTRVLHNNSGSTMQLFECIDVSSLPAEERINVWWNTDTSSIEIPNNTTFAIRFMRAANGVYCWFDGTFDY